MPQMCEICGKTPSKGNRITRRGKAKKEGGVGKKTTGIARRFFRPNIQRVRAVVNHRTVRINVCTTCIRSGKITKPSSIPRTKREPAAAVAAGA